MGDNLYDSYFRDIVDFSTEVYEAPTSQKSLSEIVIFLRTCCEYGEVVRPDSGTMLEDVRKYLEKKLGEIYVDSDVTDKVDTYKIQHPPTLVSIDFSCRRNGSELNEIRTNIDRIRSQPQAAQRTKEWYENRHSMVTASDAYKLFSTIKSWENFLRDKSLPIDLNKSFSRPFRACAHGICFEPLAKEWFERISNVQVEEFGCIRHKSLLFVGGSPDGIVCDPPDSPFYGNTIEIKCPISRKIKQGGILKKYWIQVQIQMEVLDISFCHFLECKFDCSEPPLLKKGKARGLSLHFLKSGIEDVYVHMPLEIVDEDPPVTDAMREAWKKETTDTYLLDHELVKEIPWVLTDTNCLKVERDEEWFASKKPIFDKFWKEVVYHRKFPDKLPKKTKKIGPYQEKCLLSF
jgi:putative phage-type endonuclease